MSPCYKADVHDQVDVDDAAHVAHLRAFVIRKYEAFHVLWGCRRRWGANACHAMDGYLGMGSFGTLSATAVPFHDPSAQSRHALRCAILSAFIMISREEIRRERGGGKREEMRSLDCITFLSGVILQIITFRIYHRLAKLKS